MAIRGNGIPPTMAIEAPGATIAAGSHVIATPIRSPRRFTRRPAGGVTVAVAVATHDVHTVLLGPPLKISRNRHINKVTP